MGTISLPRGSYIAKLNRDWLWPPSVRVGNASVLIAGTTAVNGTYIYDGTKWVKGAYVIEKAPNWSLHDATVTYYTAPASDLPWETAWAVGAGGAAPVPSITEIIT
jgi:hypothetical protein